MCSCDLILGKPGTKKAPEDYGGLQSTQGGSERILPRDLQRVFSEEFLESVRIKTGRAQPSTCPPPYKTYGVS